MANEITFVDIMTYAAAVIAIIAAIVAWVRGGGGRDASTSDTLTAAQRWEVAKVVGTIVAGIAAVLGLAGYFAVENAARQQAAQVAARDVAASLLGGEVLVTRIAEATTVLPEGLVAAFDRADGCPPGWIDYSNARGRVIIGATPPDGVSGGLTRREFQEQRGVETHALTLEEMPKHTHDPGNPHDHFIAYDLENEGQVSAKIDGPGGETLATHTGFSGGPDGADVGVATPHENMPPYIALYFCRKTGSTGQAAG